MSCDPHDRALIYDPLKSDSDLIQSAVMDCFPHLNEWIAVTDDISVTTTTFLIEKFPVWNVVLIFVVHVADELFQ